MTFETFDLSYEVGWPDQNQHWQWHLENTLKERLWRLVTFETLDQSDEETWPDQQKDNVKDKDNDNYKDNDNNNDI